jgi:exopolyphosphatase/guanosine-5'-triphosphate,3'-diphosphate pyrophosphatase
MKKIAGIDIGTNSVLYSLFEVRGTKIVNEMYFERHSPRIGSELSGRKKPVITEASYDRLKKILTKNIKHASRHGADDILVAATSPFRLARNGVEIKKRLDSQLGCNIEILSSEREAYLSFKAAAGNIKGNEAVMVIDMGGGSTELVVYQGEKRLAFVSLPEGAVSLTEKFNSQRQVSPDDFDGFEKFLSRYQNQADIVRPYLKAPIKLVGGTSTALAWFKDRDILNRPGGVTLTLKDVNQYIDLLAPLSLTCRRQLLAIDKKRAEIIFAGAFWYGYLFKLLTINRARAVPWGLRHGVVLDFLQSRVFTT